MPAVTNISTYRFTALAGLKELREELLELCGQRALKGTILLSTEGINLFVAGSAESIDHLLARLRAVSGLEDLAPKVSLSEEQPFNRMLVRIKREIISFGVEAVRPADHTSPKISPRELKRWLDEGRPVTLLDTRNDYEVKLGTFKGAIDPDIRTFRGFPDAVRKLPAELKDRPVVMFCTGGIRCEKAGPFMEMQGFSNIYQLDGGILKYFEECGGDHYEGDCFVFDRRVGLDPALHESGHAVCFACLAPLDDEDQKDPRYVRGKTCPHCFKSEPGQLAQRIALREEAIRRACDPLPGSVPLENRRPVGVSAAHDKWRLLDVLIEVFPQIPAAEWEARCDAGCFVSYAGAVRGKDHIVRAGERVLQVFAPEIEPEVATGIRVLYEDEALLVVNKPAPLPMHSGGRFHRNTLQNFLNLACAPFPPRAVHRLDANTTGVVLFARTRHFCRLMQRQFTDGVVEKRYLAAVSGHPASDVFACDAPVSAENGAMGTRRIDQENGLPARTEFTVMERRADGTSLLEARLFTGRTHQIRLHLSHLGHPVLGDPSYPADGRPGPAQTLDPDAAPLQLHAWKLAVRHPRSGNLMEFEAAPQAWSRSQEGSSNSVSSAQQPSLQNQ
ncbi:MAG: sulfurtransferase [Akkermansiaceae bacterium]|nr:sulfurtransferase [Akkermansiaceae bacterium]MCU0776707.1 sulfurtransferase [Akkermansiaceae bacterium]